MMEYNILNNFDFLNDDEEIGACLAKSYSNSQSNSNSQGSHSPHRLGESSVFSHSFQPVGFSNGNQHLSSFDEQACGSNSIHKSAPTRVYQNSGLDQMFLHQTFDQYNRASDSQQLWQQSTHV